MQRTVLCYGDSNTWGYKPSTYDASEISRYAREERWPGVLQKLLGEGYYIIEEGLNSRTTNLDYPIYPDRNGKTYLPPCLYTHSPIDIVLLALGGNDLKKYFDRTPEEIQTGLKELVDIIQSSRYGSEMKVEPKILIMTAPIPLDVAENFYDENGIAVFQGAKKKAQLLVDLYSQTAKSKNCYFVDLSKKVIPSPLDGLHFDKEGHELIAQILHKEIKHIFHNTNI